MSLTNDRRSWNKYFMRIISQLVPDGTPVSTDIEATRRPGRSSWEIPAWGHPVPLGVYPLFITSTLREILPVGTAFCMSTLGVTMTALHNIRESVRHYYKGHMIRNRESHPDSRMMRDIGMAIFHHQALARGKLLGNICRLGTIEEASPTDVGYVSPQFQGGFPYLPLPLSFAVPRIGSRVICVGFGDLSVPDGGFSLDDIECGRINLLDEYEHKLLAVEGRVTRIFTQRFANGFVSGPCFSIDAELPHGMSGGPVFSENGYVCGITSAGATHYFQAPTSIISLLYPLLVMNLRFGGQIGSVRIQSNRQLIELIAKGAVITDGSEKLVKIRTEGNEIILGPAMHGEDSDYLYDDFPGFRKGRHAGKESQDVYRLGPTTMEKD